ncbi:MAG: sulfatase-like hydrolase/transferase, partial [Defluviitaleaceae bacterium]|nr:sulfatase-like hydrolase/transferase [Defluviitaleaceae bacterium]
EFLPPLPFNHMPAEDEPEAIDFLINERGFRRLARERYTEEQWRLHRHAYARLTEEVDGQIQTVIDALKSSGKFENTVIILTSDHGDMDSAHKLEHKSVFYEECIRVPMLVKACRKRFAARRTRGSFQTGSTASARFWITRGLNGRLT